MLCHTMWLHFFPDNSRNSPCTVICPPAFSVLFQYRRLEGRSLSGHYLTIMQFHNRRYIHFWLEYCNRFVFGTKWVLRSFSLYSPSLCNRFVKLNKLICPYRCYHAHVNISEETLWWSLWHTHTHMRTHTHTHKTRLQRHTHAVANTTPNWTSSPRWMKLKLFPLSVTVTIMIYV